METPPKTHSLSGQNLFFPPRFAFPKSVQNYSPIVFASPGFAFSVSRRISFERVLYCLSQNFLECSKCSIKVCCSLKLNDINTCGPGSIFYLGLKCH